MKHNLIYSFIIAFSMLFILTTPAFADTGVVQFKSGFENNTYIGGSGGKYILGTDASSPSGKNTWDSLSTYFPWVVGAYAYFEGGSMEITRDPVNPLNKVLHFHNISPVSDYSRTQWEMMQSTSWTDNGTPNQFSQQFYRYKVFIPTTMKNHLEGKSWDWTYWYMIWEQHAWASEDTRHGIYIERNNSGAKNWFFRVVQQHPEGEAYTTWENTDPAYRDVAVPFGEWFNFDVFFKYHETDGRFYVAITRVNGTRQVVADYKGKTKYGTKIKDQMVLKQYHSKRWIDEIPDGMHIYYDDFEIWSDFPPGYFDSVSPTPTAPTSTKTPTPTAVIYYVSTTGNDSTGNGSQNSPWRTIQKAADTMVAGDTVIVKAGNYASERVSVTKSGSPGAPITFRAEGTVTMRGFDITANYITVKGFEITNAAWVRENNAQSDHHDGIGIIMYGSYITAEDNYIHDLSNWGIDMNSGSNNCTVKNNTFVRTMLAGAVVAGTNHLIEGNDVSATVQYDDTLWYPRTGGQDADGFRFFGYGHVFRHNSVHDIPIGTTANPDPHSDFFQTWGWTSMGGVGHDILFDSNYFHSIQHSATTSGKAWELGGAYNLTMTNNVIITDFLALATENCYNLTFLNNTFVAESTYATSHGLDFHDTCHTIVIKNNIFADQSLSSGHIYTHDSAAGVTADYNCVYFTNGTPKNSMYRGAHDVWDIDPLFVNPSTSSYLSGDFHLRSGSPCVDKGFNSGVTHDYDGITRPKGAYYDIGAFEFVSGATPTPIPGDLNGDGHVDLFDYNELVTYFGNPYTIYDYNVLVANFGK